MPEVYQRLMGKDFYRETDINCLLFMTDDDITDLKNESVLYVDATFEITRLTTSWSQMLVVSYKKTVGRQSICVPGTFLNRMRVVFYKYTVLFQNSPVRNAAQSEKVRIF